MKRTPTILLAVTLGLTLPLGVSFADEHAAQQKVDANSTAPMSTGVVKKVDKSSGKVTIKHGPLDNLGMPAMTMVFRVKDPAMLDQMKAGDKINFIAEKINGAITVMRTEPAK